MRGSGEDGVNHFSLCEKATEHLSSSSTHAHRQSLSVPTSKKGVKNLISVDARFIPEKKKKKSTVVVTCEDSFSGQIPLAEKMPER